MYLRSRPSTRQKCRRMTSSISSSRLSKLLSTSPISHEFISLIMQSLTILILVARCHYKETTTSTIRADAFSLSFPPIKFTTTCSINLLATHSCFLTQRRFSGTSIKERNCQGSTSRSNERCTSRTTIFTSSNVNNYKKRTFTCLFLSNKTSNNEKTTYGSLSPLPNTQKTAKSIQHASLQKKATKKRKRTSTLATATATTKHIYKSIKSKKSAHQKKQTKKQSDKEMRKKRNAKKSDEIITFEERWNARFAELVQYKKIHGDCLVPQDYEPNKALGRWVRYQRVEYSYLMAEPIDPRFEQQAIAVAAAAATTATNMIEPTITIQYNVTSERISKLNDLGFVWDAKEAIWYQRVEELKIYKRRYGHVNVPRKEKYRKLGEWVHNQRAQYRYLHTGKEEKSYLTSNRIEILNDLGFCWDVNDAAWMNKFEMLREFVKVHGHGNVPSRYKNNEALARWATQQRAAYKSVYREDAGTNFGGYSNTNGEIVVQSRRSSLKSSSHMDVAAYRRPLTPERVEMLNSLDFVWDPADTFWWEQYRALKKYQQEHGHCSIPSNSSISPRLRNWVNNQRRLCKDYVQLISESTNGSSRSVHEKKVEKEENMDNIQMSRKTKNHSKTHFIVPGLNYERLEALRNIHFAYLPSLGECGNGTETAKETNLRERSPSSETSVRQQPSIAEPNCKPNAIRSPVTKVEKKSFVPFPWDEI